MSSPRSNSLLPFTPLAVALCLPLLCATACDIGYGLNKKDDDIITPDDDDDTGIYDSAGTPTEICDGEDNDGDGEIDEGFWDVDGDGIKDCVDDDCEVKAPADVSEQDESCEGETTSPPVDPWNWTMEWSWRSASVYSTPVVGDLDLDGIPEVGFTSSYGSGTFHILNGKTGTENWSVPGIDFYSGMAFGDVDGDGYGDVIATTGACMQPHDVVAYDRNGTLLWRVTGPSNACETYPVITDLEGDGDIEIIVNEKVYDGATGTWQFDLAIASSSANWGAPAVADMDGDGIQEIMLENRMYNSTGALLMNCGVGGIGSFPHPVNVDADPEGELLVAGFGSMTLCDDDGSTLWTRSYTSYGSPIAVADFDGDGEQEFAFAKMGNLFLIERDNTVRWQTTIKDTSGLAGCTSWDIDLDGVPEVVYADEDDILVLDGVTGNVVIRETAHGSITLAETPAVADVDGDGQGELLYGSNNGSISGISVIGGADGDWPYARPVYNQYSYYGANVKDDLSVPPTPLAPWLAAPNLFRGQPSGVFVQATPNLKARIDDACVASCTTDGLVKFTGVVWNSGGVVVEAGTPYSISGWVSGGLNEIATHVLTKDLEPGESETFSLEAVKGEVGEELQIVADPTNAIDECYEDDNSGVFSGWECP